MKKTKQIATKKKFKGISGILFPIPKGYDIQFNEKNQTWSWYYDKKNNKKGFKSFAGLKLSILKHKLTN